MGLGCGVLVGSLILVMWGGCLGQGDFWRAGSTALQYQYNCGEHGMQLLVFPRQNRDVRFKVVDEFGTTFEVSNCSICRHWITSNNGSVTFSAGYNGCHVVKKDGRNHLKVRLEELTRNRVAAAHDINLTCPKLQEYVPEINMRLGPLPQPEPGQVHPNPQPDLTNLESQARPVPNIMNTPPQQRPLPGLVHPEVQPQPRPGLIHPEVRPQPRPGLGQPAVRPQPRPGLVHPEVQQPRPGLVHPDVQTGMLSVHSIGSSLTLEQCKVSSGRIPCADAQGPAACYQTGCCYDGQDRTTPCYYGNTVTVQCLRNGHFILVVSRDMLDYPIILDSVRLSYAQAGCDPVRKTESFLVFRFPLTQCGTTIQVAGGRLIYENQLVSGIDILSGPDGSITRDSTFILNARCIYNATDFLPVQVEVFPLPSPAPVLQVGPLRLELRIATDSSYTFYYSDTDYPVLKVLREPVHVEVRLLQRMDPSLVLVLHECWATPSTNPLEQLQWPILVDGCPFEGDNYKTQLVPMGPATSALPFPTHYQRFIISTFTFVDSSSYLVLDGLVYLFCSVSVCHPSRLEPCRVPCQMPVASRHRRFLEMSNGTESLDLVSTYGAVIFQESNHSYEPEVKQDKSTISSEGLTWTLLVALPLVGIILFVTALVLWKKKSRATKL
uniref:Zona pellucida glycoprotein 1 n=1 Tax=Anolis carolinensis TaxID=28377 RepID=H9GPQ6_ANOCA